MFHIAKSRRQFRHLVILAAWIISAGFTVQAHAQLAEPSVSSVIRVRYHLQSTTFQNLYMQGIAVKCATDVTPALLKRGGFHPELDTVVCFDTDQELKQQ